LRAVTCRLSSFGSSLWACEQDSARTNRMMICPSRIRPDSAKAPTTQVPCSCACPCREAGAIFPTPNCDRPDHLRVACRRAKGVLVSVYGFVDEWATTCTLSLLVYHADAATSARPGPRSCKATWAVVTEESNPCQPCSGAQRQLNKGIPKVFDDQRIDRRFSTHSGKRKRLQ